MTQSEAKQLLSDPTFAAWANGAKVQVLDINGWDNARPDADIAYHDFLIGEVRIKPEPKLRAWKPEEVPVGAWYRRKEIEGRHAGYHSLILAVCPTESLPIVFVAPAGNFAADDLQYALEICEHSTDGGKTWLPCGVMEDAQ